MRVARVRATALAGLTLTGCGARHQERELTGWLKVDVIRPVTGSSGQVVAGPNEEVFYVKVGSGWKRLGSGHPCRYMVLNDPNKESYEKESQPAALVDFNDGKGMRIVRAGEANPRLVKDVFGASDEFSVPPGRGAIDFLDCRERATPAGCRDLQIHRYDWAGKPLASFHYGLGDAYPECRILGIRWYDSAEAPVLDAQCAPDAGTAQCLWLMAGTEGPVVRPVGRDRPPSECSDSPGLNVALGNAERFDVLH